jgi:hypothetical protein
MSDYACMRRLGEILHNVHANAIPSFDLLHAVVDHAAAHYSYFHVLFEAIRWHICVPLQARIYLRSVKQFPTCRGTGFPSLGSAIERFMRIVLLKWHILVPKVCLVLRYARNRFPTGRHRCWMVGLVLKIYAKFSTEFCFDSS